MKTQQPDDRACYLVEWYRPELTDDDLDRTAARLQECVASMTVQGFAVSLLMTLGVPADEMVFGVFAAPSADVVAQLCREAGMAPQRLTGTLDARVCGRNEN